MSTYQSEMPPVMPRQRGSVWNALFYVVLFMAIGYAVWWWFATPDTKMIEQTPITTVDTSVMHKVCNGGECFAVRMCTAVGGDCASMEPGPAANYGTGFHVSADGRTRPNPPAGFVWASCPAGLRFYPDTKECK